jgi:uroporphyrin-III C-methyltransferase
LVSRREYCARRLTRLIPHSCSPAGITMPNFEPGTVWLVGAGPGDPGLLTLHALNALQQADVIVYDALVSDAVLYLAKPSVVKEFAGKRGGQPSTSQRDICEHIIALARAGQRVLRLKGGDPFVFGRGGEEALALATAGIPFRVVPGVTAGLAGLTYASIPATTRETNYGVILATGHCASDAGTNPDWGAMVRTRLPIILYMAMTKLNSIVEALRAGGAACDLPVAIVTEATTARQRVLVSSLERVGEDVVALGLTAPAIVAIGGIVGLRAALAPMAISWEVAP